jgi:transposase
LIAAQFVKPYKKTKQKNDRVDAQAITEAAQRPEMRYVGVKTIFQQDLQSLHRIRQQLISSRTQISNQIRGLLAEYGVVMDKSIEKFKAQFSAVLEEDSELTPVLREASLSLYELFKKIEEEQGKVERQIHNLVRENDDYQRLTKIPGVGPWSASLFLASAGNVGAFKNGRQLAAWAGLVPKQHSSGGQQRLGSITKAGDGPLRTMLVHGARSAILAAIKKQKTDPTSQWILKLHQSKGFNKTAVAVANKNVRVMWHLLKYKEEYRAS